MSLKYSPAVIFAEDIDRVMTGGRTIKVDDILNNVDGIDSKNTEIIAVLTTNHVENIERAMLRPGRFDAIISVTPPDAVAAEKLIRQYSRTLLSEDTDLSEAGKELSGQIPAVIREAVERAKLYAINRASKEGTELSITGADITASARGMKRHLELLNPKVEVEMNDHEALGHYMSKIMEDVLNTTGKRVEAIHEQIVQ